MKFSRTLQLLLATTAIIGFYPLSSVSATSFGEKEVDDNQFAVVAAPYRHGYNLLVLEQVPGQRKCWHEIGRNPTVVQPLFLDFDFTDACIRSSDSNNYSIRFNGQDYGLDYLLNIVEKDGELHLVGTPRDSSKPKIHLGRTHGLSSGSLKIQLHSGWHLTKRTYEGNTTDHVYISNTPQVKEQFVSHLYPTNSSNNNQSNNPQFYNSQPNNPPVNYQPPVNYPVQQPVGNVYQPPVNYPVQQPVGNVYQPPVNYPVQQPGGNVYQPSANYPVSPTRVNHQQQ